jgi:hypothetical protein
MIRIILISMAYHLVGQTILSKIGMIFFVRYFAKSQDMRRKIGRPPFELVFIFKVLVFKKYYNPSDGQASIPAPLDIHVI